MTESVVLRPLMLADVPAVYAAIRESYAELSPWMPWCTPEYDQAGIGAFIENSHKARQGGLAFEFGIFTPDGEYVGNCGLNGVNRENRFANLGYWIRTRRTRRGLATQAVRALVHWGFEHTDLNRLEVLVSAENAPSLRVAERSGATREGVLRRRLLLLGRSHDAVVFSFVRGGVQP